MTSKKGFGNGDRLVRELGMTQQELRCVVDDLRSFRERMDSHLKKISANGQTEE